MAKYYFYTKTDSTMEAIYTTDAQSIEEATLIFSIGKQLEVEVFRDLYGVKIKS